MSSSLFARALAALTFAAALSAQAVNCRQLAHVDKFPGAQTPINNYAGIWGMVIAGKEYAIVTARTGTIVYDCSDPQNPVERSFIPGPGSSSQPYFWREANSFGNYAYVSSEHGALQAVNLSNPSAPVTNTFGGSAHTLSIDQGTGYLWASGGSSPGGGCRIFNLNTSPTVPPQIGTYSAAYVHDCLPIRGYAYLAQISAGNMRILDARNVTNMPILSTTQTPGNFTHNVWVTDDDRIAVTADENRGGGLTVYDISNKSAPVQRATWFSPAGATVHNVFIKGSVAHFSSYSAGYYALDISNPTSPQLIASFDTSTYTGNNYHGCWGCYPFQPSGVIYLSDMQSGFWIVEPTSGVPLLYGNGTAGTSGVPANDYKGGFAKVGNATFQLTGKKLRANAPVALILGAAEGSLPVLGIDLLVSLGAPFVIASATSDANGEVAFPTPIANDPGLANGTFFSQLIVADPAGPQGLAASRGMKLTISP